MVAHTVLLTTPIEKKKLILFSKILKLSITWFFKQKIISAAWNFFFQLCLSRRFFVEIQLTHAELLHYFINIEVYRYNTQTFDPISRQTEILYLNVFGSSSLKLTSTFENKYVILPTVFTWSDLSQCPMSHRFLPLSLSFVAIRVGPNSYIVIQYSFMQTE